MSTQNKPKKFKDMTTGGKAAMVIFWFMCFSTVVGLIMLSEGDLTLPEFLSYPIIAAVAWYANKKLEQEADKNKAAKEASDQAQREQQARQEAERLQRERDQLAQEQIRQAQEQEKQRMRQSAMASFSQPEPMNIPPVSQPEQVNMPPVSQPAPAPVSEAPAVSQSLRKAPKPVAKTYVPQPVVEAYVPQQEDEQEVDPMVEQMRRMLGGVEDTPAAPINDVFAQEAKLD